MKQGHRPLNQSIVDAAVETARAHEHTGKVADYIPVLAKLDPEKVGLTVFTKNGHEYSSGSVDTKFPIQSVSKVFSLALAFRLCPDRVMDCVGWEPSGDPFNSIVQLEREEGRPRNPFINSGALVITDRILTACGDTSPTETIIDFMSELTSEKISVDYEVAKSESEHGERNRSLAYFLATYGTLENPVEKVVKAYFEHCAIAMNCRQLAKAGQFLSDEAKCAKHLGCDTYSSRINALMSSCGNYDRSGEFAAHIGICGKSGVSGAILGVVPHEASMAVWSPGLDNHGTSVKGFVAMEHLSNLMDWSIF